DPAARVSGFGGRRMLAARADLLFPLTDLAVMGLVRVLANLRTFFRLGRQAEAFFHTDRPDAVVLIDYPGFNFALAKRAHAAGLPLEVHGGRTPELIELADACVSVAGSVGLELLYRLKPTVVVYRLGRVMNFVLRRLVHVRFMSLVNLLADDEVYPEFATPRDESGAIAGHVLRWLSDPAARSATVARLRALR